MRIYISGPITGVPEHRKVFEEIARLVEACGGEPLIPQDISPEHEGPCPWGPKGSGELGHVWACHLRKDLSEMLECDAVLMMCGWEISPGARLEQQVAAACGLTIFYCLGRALPQTSNGTPLAAWVRNMDLAAEGRRVDRMLDGRGFRAARKA